ncbi:MAG: response regulator [Candidatus Melainabacteria bacterium]|nr:response regulator [Candidatus Melainabacteria bacterium]
MGKDKCSRRVLVVEDSPTQAQHLKFILSSAGFEVEVAYDGESAFEKFLNGQFDLVLSDVVMPGLSGYELCRMIKRSRQGSDVPVVLVTVLNRLQDLIEGLRSGADNFLTKPYEPSFLVARLTNILQENQGEPTLSVCDPESGQCFVDTRFITNLDKKRILDYLVSTFDDFLYARQRQSEIKLVEAKQRIDEIRQREGEIADLVHGLQALLAHAEDNLNWLLDKRFGAVEARQELVLAEVKANIEDGLKMLANVLETPSQEVYPGVVSKSMIQSVLPAREFDVSF